MASHDGLQTQEIEEYKNAIEYIKNSQIFDGHLDLKEISPNIFKQNVEFELNKIKKSLKDESSYNEKYPILFLEYILITFKQFPL